MHMCIYISSCNYVSNWKFRKGTKKSNKCVKHNGLVKIVVMICHRSVIDMFDQLQQQRDLTENNSPGMSSFVFIVSNQYTNQSSKLNSFFEIIYQFIKAYNVQLSHYGLRALGKDVCKVPYHPCRCRHFGHPSNNGIEDESKLSETCKTLHAIQKYISEFHFIVQLVILFS